MPITAQAQPNKGWFDSIKDAVYNIYDGIINTVKDNPFTKLIANPFNGLTGFLKKQENPDRVKIDQLRQKHFDLIAKERAKPNPDYNAVTKVITDDIKNFARGIIDQEIKKLGKPPCEIEFDILGSGARREAGPITDFELLLLVDKKTVASVKYAYELTQRIADRLFLLGEHPDIGGKGFRMDEADNAPPHYRFWARNATPEQAQQLVTEAIAKKEWDKIPFEGSRPFLATPEEFASFSDPNFAQDKDKMRKMRKEQFEKELTLALKDPKNAKRKKTAEGRKEIENEIHFWLNKIYQPFSTREKSIAETGGRKLGRNLAPLYGSGELFKRLMTRRELILSKKRESGLTERQYIAVSKMQGDIQEVLQKGKSIYLTGELGKTLDIKRELYRFTEQWLTNLGFFYKCESQNCMDILKELTDKGIINKDFSDKFAQFLQFVNGLRLKEQTLLKRQGFAAYFDQAEFDEDKRKLEEQVANMKQTIEYMEQTPGIKPESIATKNRELFKLQSKLDHLLDMAPNKLYSKSDIEQLKGWLPFAKEIFDLTCKWTQNPSEKIAMDYKVAPQGKIAAAAQAQAAAAVAKALPAPAKVMPAAKALPVLTKAVPANKAQPAAAKALPTPAKVVAAAKVAIKVEPAHHIGDVPAVHPQATPAPAAPSKIFNLFNALKLFKMNHPPLKHPEVIATPDLVKAAGKTAPAV